MHQPPMEFVRQLAGPPQWTPYTPYGLGAEVVWAGTVWRCEAGHSSGTSDVPTQSFHLWTPISSSGYYAPPPQQMQYYQKQYVAQPQPPSYTAPPAYPYNQYDANQQHQAPSQSTQNYQSSSQIYAPQPLPMPSKPPSTSSFGSGSNEKSSSSSSSSDSEGTVTGESNSRGLLDSSRNKWSMENIQATANEGLRYVTMKDEMRKVKEKDELKDELKGKRIWRTGGIGVMGYSRDEREEEGKRDVWSRWGEKHGREEWIKASRARTDFYARDSRGVKPAVMWKLVERGGRLPDDALPIGHEADGVLLYAARAWWEGGLHLGKAGPHLVNSASISYGGSEHSLDIYEVLCAPLDPALLKWMTFRHGESVGVEDWQPVEGGRERDGKVILVAKGEYENGEHPGKICINDDHACVGYGGGELWVRPFQVLAYTSQTRR